MFEYTLMKPSQFVNGNVITNEVGSRADVLAVLKTVKAKPAVAQVEELEIA